MRIPSTGWLLAAGLTGTLALAASPARAQLPSKVGDEIAVGTNATGEACRLRMIFDSKDAIAFQRFFLFCQGWTTPSGDLARFRVSREYTAERIVDESGWSKRFIAPKVAACKDLEKTTLVGAPGSLRQCERAEGLGWPVIVAGVVVKGQRGYGLEALPTNVRVLERAAEILEGLRPPAQLDAQEGAFSAAVRRAEAIVGKSGKPIAVADLGTLQEAWNLGKRQFRAGNRAGAEDAFRRTLEVSQRVFGVDAPSQGGIMAELALTIGSQGGRFEEAQRLYARAEPLTQRSGDLDDAPRLQAYRAWTFVHDGRPKEALAPAQAALAQRERQARSDATGPLAHSQWTLAYVYRWLGQLDDAAIYADKALRYFDTSGPAPEWRAYHSMDIRSMLADIAERQKRLPEARTHREDALKRAEAWFGDSPVTGRALYALGRQSRLEGDLAGALVSLRRGAEIQIRGRSLRGRVRALEVDEYVDTLLAAAAADPAQVGAHHAEALTAVQIPRDTEAAKALQQMAGRIAAADPALSAVARDLQDAQRRRDRLRAQLAEEAVRPPDQRLSPAQVAALTQQQQEAEQAIEAAEQRLQAQFPRYAHFTRDLPVAAAELIPLLGDDEALVHLLVGREETFVSVVRKAGVRVHRVRVGSRAVQREVAAIRKSVDATSGQIAPFDVAAAHRLYTQLLGPAAAQLAGARQLVIVPSGPLLSVPKGLLVTKAPAAAPADDYRGVAWLAREYALSTAPSIRAFRDLRAAGVGARAPQPFIGFGDPAFLGGGTDGAALAALNAVCREDRGVDPALVAGLPRLRESALELRQIAQSLSAGAAGTVVTGAEATEKKVREADLAQYRVVAFATHGLLPGELHCQAEPALALTPPAAPTDRSSDGLLDASEVAQLRLNADWVVLSACNTADPAGKLGGESLSGLTQAFFYAGARAVLATHWAIASRPTVQLTTGALGVYGREPAVGKAEALRRSQMALAGEKETSHPFYWAAFVLSGDGGPGR